MPVTFTKHARERMEERNISIGQVMRILAFGRLIQARLNDVWAVDSQRVPDQSWLECLSNIAVVCTKNLQVVTVYRIGMSAAQ